MKKNKMSAILKHFNYIGCYRILIIFLALWLIVLVLSAFPMLNLSANSDSESKLSERLSRALIDLEALRKQNDELQDIFRDLSVNNLNDDQKEAIENFQLRLTKAEHSPNKQNLGFISPKEEPNTQYEVLRRRLYLNTNEMWYFIHTNLVDIQKKVGEIAPDIMDSLNYVINLGLEHKRSLLLDIEHLSEVDGYGKWREKESESLSNLVQERFSFLQNPKNCKTARKLVCSLNKGCGFGCQLHHAVYCFMVAYGTKRTLILKSKGWRYHKAGWEEVFKPVSDTCLDPDGEIVSNWPGHEDTQVVNLPIIDSLSPRPPFLPLAVPEDLALINSYPWRPNSMVGRTNIEISSETSRENFYDDSGNNVKNGFQETSCWCPCSKN